jgi:hypothetical protein
MLLIRRIYIRFWERRPPISPLRRRVSEEVINGLLTCAAAAVAIACTNGPTLDSMAAPDPPLPICLSFRGEAGIQGVAEPLEMTRCRVTNCTRGCTLAGRKGHGRFGVADAKSSSLHGPSTATQTTLSNVSWPRLKPRPRRGFSVCGHRTLGPKRLASWFIEAAPA